MGPYRHRGRTAFFGVFIQNGVVVLTSLLLKILSQLRFVWVVVIRHVIILFRRNRSVKLVYLNYSTEHLFNQSYLQISYKFKNAVYYQIAGKKTLNKQMAIIDLKHHNHTFDIIVHGFLQKNTFQISISPQHSLDHSSFKTQIANLNVQLKEVAIPQLTPLSVAYTITPPTIIPNKIELISPKVQITHSAFNQNEYI